MRKIVDRDLSKTLKEQIKNSEDNGWKYMYAMLQFNEISDKEAEQNAECQLMFIEREES